ncbi:MAG: TonB-dependent receptor plug domain-containing protein [Ekhidna sp.]
MLKYFYSTVLILLTYSSFSQKLVVDLFNEFHNENPIEKIYVSTDKQIYTIGENLHYKMFLVDGVSHNASQISSVAYIELVRGDEILLDQVLKIGNGQAKGNIFLSDTLESGKYILRAYTQYQLNFDNQYIFSKEIEIKSPSMNLNYLAENNSVFDFQVFPEGGHILQEVNNVIGFKCTDKTGAGVPLSGILIANKDTVVSFNSTHMGMGKFSFTPKEGVKYHINYTVANKTNEYKIKDIKNAGYKMTLAKGRTNARLIVSSNYQELDFENTFVVAQSRGKVLAVLNPKKNTKLIHFKIPNSRFPTGVIQLTFFKNENPLLERIYFNENEILDVGVTHDSNSSKTDSVISHKILLLNDSIKTDGHATISVLQKGSKASSQNIKSYLLLASDINGIIENSAYYFDNENLKRQEHLDLLMLTQGWRSYEWDDILLEEREKLNLLPEQGISIEGTIRSIKTNDGVPRKASLYTMNNFEFEYEFQSEKDGSFKISNLDIKDSVSLVIQAMKEKKVKGQKIKVPDDGVYVELNDARNPINFLNKNITTENSGSSLQTSEFDISKLENVKVLDDVVVTAQRQEEENKFKRDGMLYRNPDKRVVMDAKKETYASVMDLIKVEVPGIITIPPPINQPGEEPTILLRNSEVMFMLDGVRISTSALDFVNPFQIDFLDVLRGAQSSVYGAQSAILLFSKTGFSDKEAFNTGSTTINLVGFQKAKKFYSPKFSQVSNNYLTTIHWNPDVTFDQGKFSLEFPNYKLDQGYVVFMEGITYSGHPFSYQFSDSFDN